jgi:carbonic anhydrase-like protein
MEKAFHFDSPAEVYKADACVLSCFDYRFTLAVRKFLRRRGLGAVDHIQIPGSAKALAAPDRESDRDFVLGMVRTSIRLHASERMLILGHNECGAYPGAPPETVAADVARAAEIVRAAEPSLTIECYFCDFDGVYRIS